MARSDLLKKWWKVLAAASAATVLATNCSDDQWARVATGVEAAITYDNRSNDDISFGDWLWDEAQDW